jgi:hypothetical protein
VRKFLLIVASVFLVLVIGSVIGARIVYQKVVESDGFREKVAGALTQGAQSFVSNSVVDISSLTVSGLINVETGNINIRSGERSEHVVSIKSAIVKPDLWSLITLGPISFRADVSVSPLGTVDVTGKISFGMFSGAGEEQSYAEITGKIHDLDAVPVADLIQTAQADPYFRLTEGTMNGNFQFLKTSGTDDSPGQKNGFLNLEIKKSQWMIASDKNRIIPIERLPVELTLRDFLIKLEKPVQLVDDAGTATLTGSVLLPKRKDQEKSWDMQAKVDGSSNLLLVVARLFKCQTPPMSYHFQVAGPFSKSRCTPVPAGG